MSLQPLRPARIALVANSRIWPLKKVARRAPRCVRHISFLIRFQSNMLFDARASDDFTFGCAAVKSR